VSRALIIGHAGQDGRLLFDQLVRRGFSVVGIGKTGVRRRLAGGRLEDLAQGNTTTKDVVRSFRPESVYFLAAFHHSSQDVVIDDQEVSRLSWHTHVHLFEHVLEMLSKLESRPRVFYASSSRIYGDSMESPQSETTRWAPKCLYGVTKASGMLVANYYRNARSMHVSSGILFNHESPLRGTQFVTKRVIEGLIAIKRGEAKSLEIGSLDARVDWGYAPDYTRAMQLMLERSSPSDRVIATGQTHSVRDLVECAATFVGLDWRGVVVERENILQRSSQDLCGDSSALREETGWLPSVTFREMVGIMVKAAIEQPR
jgi:GDPmannose 4,6-dehydratase